MSIPKSPQNLCPSSSSTSLSPNPFKIPIPKSPQYNYPQSPSKSLSPNPLKISIPESHQNLYLQLSPNHFKMYIPNPPQNVYPPNLSKCLCPNPLTMNSKQPIIKSEVFNPGGCSMEKREPTTQQWRQIHSCTADPRTHPPTNRPSRLPVHPPNPPT